MYVCVYVCTHFNIYMYRMRTYIRDISVHVVCTCFMYVCIYVCLYVCMNVCMYVFIYICMYVCMYVYVAMNVCMCLCVQAEWDILQLESESEP